MCPDVYPDSIRYEEIDQGKRWLTYKNFELLPKSRFLCWMRQTKFLWNVNTLLEIYRWRLSFIMTFWHSWFFISDCIDPDIYPIKNKKKKKNSKCQEKKVRDSPGFFAKSRIGIRDFSEVPSIRADTRSADFNIRGHVLGIVSVGQIVRIWIRIIRTSRFWPRVNYAS